MYTKAHMKDSIHAEFIILDLWQQFHKVVAVVSYFMKYGSELPAPKQ